MDKINFNRVLTPSHKPKLVKNCPILKNYLCLKKVQLRVKKKQKGSQI
jgi:hypothetical protein